MENQIAVPEPDPASDHYERDHHASRSGNERQRGRNADRRRKDRLIYTRTQCMELLSQLPGMVKIGYLSPSEASAIERILKTILAEHRQSQHPKAASAPVPPDLLKLIRENPGLQPWFEPLLSDADLEQLMSDSDE
jgi:hypothetical protein